MDRVLPAQRRHLAVRYSSLLSAFCGQKAPARSTVFNWVRSLKSGKKTAQTSAHDWYSNSPSEWFLEAIRMIRMRCRRYKPRRGICWARSCSVFTQPKIIQLLQMSESTSFSNTSLSTVVAETEFCYWIWKWFSQPIWIKNCTVIIIIIIIMTIIKYFFIIKPTRCTNFPNLLRHETLYVSFSPSTHHQEFIHCKLGTGIHVCHTGM